MPVFSLASIMEWNEAVCWNLLLRTSKTSFRLSLKYICDTFRNVYNEMERPYGIQLTALRIKSSNS